MPIYVYRDSLREEERALIVSSLERLATYSFEDLCALPESSRIPVPEGLAPFTAHVYREPVDKGIVRVVVQGVRDTNKFLFLQFAAVEAAGFSRDRSGALKELQPQDLYDYT